MKITLHSLLTICAIFLACGPWATLADETLTETELSNTERDPFWPVNYTPPSRVETPTEMGEERENTVDMKNLTEEQRAKIKSRIKISGIFKHSGKFVARVNNQLVSAGETVAVEFEGKVYRFKIKDISKDSVQLEPAES